MNSLLKRKQVLTGLLILGAGISSLLVSPYPLQAEIRDWTFDETADYTVSDPSGIEVTDGAALSMSAFDGLGWNYRKALTIANPNSQLEEYQVEVKIDSSHTNFWTHVADDGSDIRFTDADGVTFIDFYIYHFDFALQEAGIWVKVPILSSPEHTIYLHYGNPSASSASDMVATFSYSEPKTVGYVVSNRIATTGTLNILSLADDNKIEMETTTHTLQLREGLQEPHTAISQGTAIAATSLFHADGSADGTDMISPVSWAATEFTYYSQRNTNTFNLLSPWGDAQVEIYSGGNLQWSGVVDSNGTVANADITNGRVVKVTSDIPILAQHVSTGADDAGVYYPATGDYLYGIPSNYLEMGSGSSGAQASWITSDGTAGSQLISGDRGYSQRVGNSQGSGPAFRVKSGDNPVGVNQLADSDGGEFTVFLPKKEMGSRFGANNTVQYIAVAAPYPNTTCTVYDSAGNSVATQTGGTRNDINKIYFGSSSNHNWEDAGWTCECDKPVYAYYEKDNGSSSDPDDETNLMSYPQMRQFIYPTPALDTIGNEESLFTSDNLWVAPTPENAQPFSSVSHFIETAQKNGGDIYYQLSNDGGENWLYWNDIAWVPARSHDFTTADLIQDNIAGFPTGDGRFLFKAFLISDGSAPVQLDNIEITYLITLQVTDIEPGFGYAGSETSVEIYGRNFQEDVTVTLGGIVCDVNTITATTIQATIPQGLDSGLHDLAVASSAGEVAVLPEAFLVIASSDFIDSSLPPFVDGIYPDTITSEKDTPVIILGENFITMPRVIVGERVLTEVEYISSNTLKVTIPQDMPVGSYDITVINPNGRNHLREEVLFIVAPIPPVIMTVLPDSTLDTTTGDIAIIGLNFEEGSVVMLGDTVLPDVHYISSTTLLIRIPSGIVGGVYDLVVINPDGRRAQLDNGFTVVSSKSPLPQGVELAVFPRIVLGTEMAPLFNMTLIHSQEQFTFTESSLVSFNSDDLSIRNQLLLNDYTMLVFYTCLPDPQTRTIDITITDVDRDGELTTITDINVLNVILLSKILN